MSHALALVIVPVSDITDLDSIAKAVELLMEAGNEAKAYDLHPEWDLFEDRSDAPGYNPNDNGWWDWYVIGGRWDGVIQGANRRATCAACTADGGWHHGYDDDHHQLANNVAWIRDLGEQGFYATVTPEGEARERDHWVPSPEKTHFPWSWVVDESYDRWSMEQRIKYRNLVGVGVDFHS